MSTEEPTNPYERRKADTKRRLREAIERLLAGKPQNPDVRGRRWKLDVKTVAQEAGVSRNAIYQNHPEIIDEVQAARRAPGANAGASIRNSKMRRLKQALKQCDHERRVLATQNAELLSRAQFAEKQLKELRAHHRRLSGAS